MNPPYVSKLVQKKISGTFIKNPSEWKSGNGGDGWYTHCKRIIKNV